MKTFNIIIKNENETYQTQIRACKIWTAANRALNQWGGKTWKGYNRQTNQFIWQKGPGYKKKYKRITLEIQKSR